MLHVCLHQVCRSCHSCYAQLLTDLSFRFRLGGVWRTAYGIGIIPILYMLYYRIFRLRESAVWKKRKSNEPRNMGKLFAHYWYASTALCRFALLVCMALLSCAAPGVVLVFLPCNEEPHNVSMNCMA